MVLSTQSYYILRLFFVYFSIISFLLVIRRPLIFGFYLTFRVVSGFHYVFSKVCSFIFMIFKSNSRRF